MQPVTVYVANDGEQFSTPEKALERDQLIEDIDAVMSALKPTPRSSFEGYVQQDKASVEQVQRGLYNLLLKYEVISWWINRQKNDFKKTDKDLIGTHPSWFLRMIDGTCRPFERAYGRLYRIDSDYREWEQPYYAINPGTGKDVCIG